MFSTAIRSRVGLQTVKRMGTYSACRFFAAKSDLGGKDVSKKAEAAVEEKKSETPVEKTSSKKDAEYPDFPEYPQIRADFEAGIRNRDYLKTVPKQKRIDLFQQKPGDVVYFDDEEFKYYFPHDFYSGFEKQKELTLMNTLQVRKETISIIKKLKAFQEGNAVNIYPFLCLTGPRGSGKSMVLRSLYYYCRCNNWITLFVPSAHTWTHKGYQIIEMTRRAGGFFAQPEHCQKLLLDLHITSGHLLKTLPCRCEYDRSLFWAKSQFGAAIDSGAIKSMNLDQLVLYGVNSARDSYEIVAYVKKELEQCTEYPVLIAVDDYNALYDYSWFEYRNEPVHARKLYLASLFRVFDEQDYLPSQDPVFDFARPSHFHTEVPADTVEEPIAPRCHFKNVLRNGIVVGAVESRYDHFIKFRDVANVGREHNVTIGACDFPTFNGFIDMFEKNGIIFPMSEAQREYMYSYTQGNYREMVWSVLTNRRWLMDYAPKGAFFEWVEKSNNAELKKLWSGI